MIFQEILQIFLLLGSPWLILYLCQKWKWLHHIGAVTLCYALGILVANLPGIPLLPEASELLITITVPLFLSLLLFNSDLRSWKNLGLGAGLSFLLMVVSVMISASLAAHYFDGKVPEVGKLAGMLVGVYTGGTPNLSAVGIALDVPKEVFIILNATDLAFGGLWLLALMSFMKPLARKFLPPSPGQDQNLSNSSLDTSFAWQGGLIALALSVGVLALSVGLSFLIQGKISEVIILLSVSTLGIIFSEIPRVGHLQGSYALGNYLLLVFCVSVGSLARMDKVLATDPNFIAMVAFVMFGAIALHLLLARLTRVDADTWIITSTAGIYGPAFIPPIARSLGNLSMIPIGVIAALLGFSVANYLGILLAYWLNS